MFWVGLVVGLIVGSNVGILVYAFITADEIED